MLNGGTKGSRAHVVLAAFIVFGTILGSGAISLAPAGAEAPIGLGGAIASRPSCLSEDGRALQCFARSSGNKLYSRTRVDGAAWGDWVQISGQNLVGAPECLTKAAGSLSCFFRTSNNTLGEASFYSGGWHDYDQGGSIASDPDCLV